MRTQGLLPKLQLVAAFRLVDLKMQVVPRQRGRLRGRHEQQAPDPIGESARGRGHRAVVALDQQGTIEQCDFPLPKHGEGLQFARRGWNVVAGDRVQPPPQVPSAPGRDVALAMVVPAAQLEDRQRRLFQGRNDVPRNGELAAGHYDRLRNLAHERLQSRIQEIDPGKVVQHTFIHAQPGRGQGGFVSRFDHAPLAQRPDRGERAPMGFRQHRQGQTEAGPRALAVAGRPGAQGRKLSVHLDPGREQQQVALEGGEVEALGKPLDGRWFGQSCPAGLHQFPGGIGRLAAQEDLEPCQFRRQEFLVGVRPVRRGSLGRVHVMTMRWLRNTGGTAVRSMIGLSIPSMRRRAR